MGDQACPAPETAEPAETPANIGAPPIQAIKAVAEGPEPVFLRRRAVIVRHYSSPLSSRPLHTTGLRRQDQSGHSSGPTRNRCRGTEPSPSRSVEQWSCLTLAVAGPAGRRQVGNALLQPRPCQIVRIRHVARAMIAGTCGAIAFEYGCSVARPATAYVSRRRQGRTSLFCGLVTPLWLYRLFGRVPPGRVDRSGESTSSANTAGPFGAPCGARSTCQHFGRASLRGGLGTHSLLYRAVR
jgi:hypothetical protein